MACLRWPFIQDMEDTNDRAVENAFSPPQCVQYLVCEQCSILSLVAERARRERRASECVSVFKVRHSTHAQRSVNWLSALWHAHTHLSSVDLSDLLHPLTPTHIPALPTIAPSPLPLPSLSPFSRPPLSLCAPPSPPTHHPPNPSPPSDHTHNPDHNAPLF